MSVLLSPGTSHFNPRSREGSDDLGFTFDVLTDEFQSTLP